MDNQQKKSSQIQQMKTQQGSNCVTIKLNNKQNSIGLETYHQHTFHVQGYLVQTWGEEIFS